MSSALRSCAGVSSLVAALLSLGAPLECGSGPGPRERALSAYDRNVVERVAARAAARLDDPRCAELLTDFRDHDGSTLAAKLAPLGVSPSRYLLELSFLDGSQLAICRPRVIMATRPGVPRVFLCPAGVGRLNSRLSRVEFENSPLAEAMLIHEMLHALGLGENPPSTFEITARVRERCH